MAEWYLATYRNGGFISDLGIIKPDGDYVYKLKNGIQSTKSPVKSDWLRISITDNKVEEWDTDNNDWVNVTSLTGLVNNSTYWVYGFIVKYIIVTNNQTYYLEDLTTLNNNDIDKNNITSITITNSVTEIGENAFSGINNNVIFIIPENVLTKLNEADTSLSLTYEIGKTFFGASKATLVKDYPYYTFITNDNRIHYLLSFSRNNNNITYRGDTDIDNITTINSTTITHVIIGSSVTVIDYKAFENCSNLVSLTIGEKVEIIRDYAFFRCTSLVSLIIPDSVTSIGDNAFSECSSLASLTIGNSVTSIGDNAFSECTSLASLTIGNSVTSIGVDAFFGCTSLTEVEIPDNVTKIGNGAFYGCFSLASLTIGNSVTEIGSLAFGGCTSLKEVNIPNTVTSIRREAFRLCSRLASVTIGSSVTSIGQDAFAGINSNNPTEAIITISQSTVRKLTGDDTLPYKYISGYEYTGETFFSSTTTVTLNVIYVTLNVI